VSLSRVVVRFPWDTQAVVWQKPFHRPPDLPVCNFVKLLTLARDLQRRRARERQSLFVAEGIRAVEELLASPLRLRGALVSLQLDATPRGSRLRAALVEREVELLKLSDKDFASAADTDAPQGVLAIAEIPERSLASSIGDAHRPTTRILLLDAIQDPGNVGTIIRTAAALGVDATVALPGTADLWSAKVVRSAAGSHFRHPAFHGTWDEVEVFLREHTIPLWGTDARGEPLDGDASPARVAIAVGNEGAGLSDVVRERAERLVSLPIAGDVESLNVAVATGIVLFELGRAGRGSPEASRMKSSIA
jgi:RNA methyltransferase, TrmH family